MLCTCKYILGILWALIIILYSAVNMLQHLKAIWGLGSVPKSIGKETPQRNTETRGKGSLYFKTAKTSAGETSIFLSLADYAKLLFALQKNG